MLETFFFATLIFLFLNRTKKKRRARSLDSELKELIQTDQENKGIALEIKNYLLSIIESNNNDEEKFNGAQLTKAQEIIDRAGPAAFYWMSDIAAQLALLSAAQINGIPTNVNVELDNFTPAERELILERDGYKCVTCGLGRESGLEMHIDHIKPRSLGGQGTLENGQTLCSRHNFIKKNYSQTETGKKSFIRLLELVQSQPDDPNSSDLESFLIEVLQVYEKHGINGHIRWKQEI